MNTLVLDRSTDTQSVALERDGKVVARVLAGTDSRSGDWPLKVRDFLAANSVAPADLDRVVVGCGPGSFAGIRAALAFAQGIALGGHAVVKGLPSTAALACAGERHAIVGDARRDRYWVIVYDGLDVEKDFFLVEKTALGDSVPAEHTVLTPDGDRIGPLLAAIFGPRYKGPATPLAAHLAEVAAARPDLLVDEPLPVYLQPPVK